MMINLPRNWLVSALAVFFLASCGSGNPEESTASAGTSGGAVEGAEIGHVKGQADAPITLIEYASPTCPACKYFHDTIKPVIEENYVATGKVRFIFREYPLNEIDVAAYALARCAGEGNFFNVLDDLFSTQDGIRAAAQNGVVRQALFAIGERHGIADQAAFDACLSDRDIRQALADTFATAETWRVDGTPTFIIDGVKYNFQGDMTNPEGFSKKLDALLAERDAQ